jgi:hypothetical protein
MQSRVSANIGTREGKTLFLQVLRENKIHGAREDLKTFPSGINTSIPHQLLPFLPSLPTSSIPHKEVGQIS